MIAYNYNITSSLNIAILFLLFIISTIYHSLLDKMINSRVPIYDDTLNSLGHNNIFANDIEYGTPSNAFLVTWPIVHGN